MSCNRGQARTAGIARRNGLQALASKKLFHLGAAVSRLARGGLQRLAHRRSAAGPAPESGQLPVLAAGSKIEPLAAKELAGVRGCAGCRAETSQKQGLWYRLEGQVYCQDCAPAVARQAGVMLAGMTASSTAVAGIPRLPAARPTVLKPTKLRVGLVDNVEGYAVSVYGRDTGLSLAPEVKVAGGQVQLNPARWFVIYNRVDQAIAGPYGSVKEAEGLASLMVNFDWTRPVEAFDDAELQQIVQIGNRYRENIEFEKKMRAINAGQAGADGG